MNIPEFEAELALDEYQPVVREVPAGTVNELHSHPFDVRALVTAGDITLTVDGTERTYHAGDVFTMAAGCMHREVIGASGVAYISGRREPKR